MVSPHWPFAAIVCPANQTTSAIKTEPIKLPQYTTAQLRNICSVLILPAARATSVIVEDVNNSEPQTTTIITPTENTKPPTNLVSPQGAPAAPVCVVV